MFIPVLFGLPLKAMNNDSVVPENVKSKVYGLKFQAADDIGFYESFPVFEEKENPFASSLDIEVTWAHNSLPKLDLSFPSYSQYSSQKLLCCGDFLHYYEFVDNDGNPVYFRYGGKKTNEINKDFQDDDYWLHDFLYKRGEADQKVWIQAQQQAVEEFVKELIVEAELQALQTTIDELVEGGLEKESRRQKWTEEQKQEERRRYHQRTKGKVKRLVQTNRLYFMLTFTFAFPDSPVDNIPGCRFSLTEEEQRDWEKVQKVANSRLTEIRKYVREKLGKKFSYVRIVEPHDSEKTSERKRGTFHIHLVTSVEIPHKVLSELWGYGCVWMSDFEKGRRIKPDGSVEYLGFVNDPGAYVAKYLNKGFESFRLPYKQVYSSSHGLVHPDRTPVYDEEEIAEICQDIQKHPEVFGKDAPKWLLQGVKQVENIEEMCSHSDTFELGELPFYTKTVVGFERLETPVFLRYKAYNFRRLHPDYKEYCKKDG